MLYFADIDNLISQWEEQAQKNKEDNSYCLAIRECVNDLKILMDDEIQQELSEQEADSYLASMEAHELWY